MALHLPIAAATTGTSSRRSSYPVVQSHGGSFLKYVPIQSTDAVFTRFQFPGKAEYPPSSSQTVYVRGGDNTPFASEHALESGFYKLSKDKNTVEYCVLKNGRKEDKLYREEDLSLSWWQSSAVRCP